MPANKRSKKPQATQQTPKGYVIPVPTRKAVLGDLKRIAKAPKPRKG